VFVPFVDGPVMHMVETPSLADLKTFKPNSWGIYEPPSIENRPEGIRFSDSGVNVELVKTSISISLLCPGLASIVG
jgi:hypothetical protein